MYQPLNNPYYEEEQATRSTKKNGLKAFLLLAGLGVLAYTGFNHSPATTHLQGVIRGDFTSKLNTQI
jgi:hypothetical protein